MERKKHKPRDKYVSMMGGPASCNSDAKTKLREKKKSIPLSCSGIDLYSWDVVTGGRNVVEPSRGFPCFSHM